MPNNSDKVAVHAGEAIKKADDCTAATGGLTV